MKISVNLVLAVVSLLLPVLSENAGFVIMAQSVKQPNVITKQTIRRDSNFSISGYKVTSVGTLDIVVDSENAIMGFHGSDNLGDGKFGVIFERIDERGEAICRYGIAITDKLPRIAFADGSALSFVPWYCFGCISFGVEPKKEPLFVLTGEHKVIEGTYRTQQDITKPLRTLAKLNEGPEKSGGNPNNIVLVNINGQYSVESGWFWSEYGELMLRDNDSITNQTGVNITVRSSSREVSLPAGEGFGGGMKMKATTIVPIGATLSHF
jgi:hypothetical protein